MESIFQKDFQIGDIHVDCFGRLRPAMILFLAQDIARAHCELLSVDYETLAKQRLFWAVTRHKVLINRLPKSGETIHMETWTMPTTRVAFPRSMVAYDAQGNELFRSISLWVLMDLDTRKMILPGNSSITLCGTLRGFELPNPGGLVPKPLENRRERTVCFTDLDRNGHMNNTKYLDWIDDLLPSAFHGSHAVREMTLCYSSEAREGQVLCYHWDFIEDNTLQVEAYRTGEDKEERTFSARLFFD